jgi:hypothetical protein
MAVGRFVANTLQGYATAYGEMAPGSAIASHRPDASSASAWRESSYLAALPPGYRARTISHVIKVGPKSVVEDSDGETRARVSAGIGLTGGA